MIRIFGCLLVLSVSCFLEETCQAETILEDASLFDFENQTPTYDARIDVARLGSLSSLTIEKDLHTISISREDVMFDLSKNVSGQAKPAVFGDVSLETFFDQQDAPFVINISPPVQQFGLTWGDYDGIPNFPEDDDVLSLKAYSGPDGTGTLLGLKTGLLVNEEFDEENPSGFAYGTTEIRADSISSVVLTAGSAKFPHSMFYDNFQVNNVPEALGSSHYLLLLFISSLLFRRSGRRRTK